MTINVETIKEIKSCNGVIKKYDNGILHFCKNDNVTKSSSEGTLELFSAITAIQKTEKCLMLLSLKGLVDMDMNCRMFLMNKLPEIATGIAFVIDDDPVTRAQFSMSSYLRKKIIPIEFFHSENEAFDWLKSLLITQ